MQNEREKLNFTWHFETLALCVRLLHVGEGHFIGSGFLRSVEYWAGIQIPHGVMPTFSFQF